MSRMKQKDRDAVINAARRCGRCGQQLIQVGRAKEIKSLISDVDRVASGGRLFAWLWEYGSGRRFS